jgi:hypothetical protein
MVSDMLQEINHMKKIAIVGILLLINVSCSTTDNDTGAYGRAYLPITQNLKKTSTVSIRLSSTEKEGLAFAKYFGDLVKNNGWQIVGSTTLAQSNYDTVQITNLAKENGSDAVWIHIQEQKVVKQKVSFGNEGYGYPYSQPINPYNPYAIPIVPPYSPPPPRGNLLGTLSNWSAAQQQLVMARQAEDERMAAFYQSQPKRQQTPRYIQQVMFFRSANKN